MGLQSATHEPNRWSARALQLAQEWAMSKSSTLIVGLAVRKERIDVVLALPSREGDSMLASSRATLQAAP